MTPTAFRFTFRGGLTIVVQGADVSELANALSRHRRPPQQRVLADEIATYLEDKLAATSTEIARAIRARDQTVRQVLSGDERFQIASSPAGRSQKARPWILSPRASGAVPCSGTSGPGGGLA